MEEFSLEQAYEIVRLHLSESGGLMDYIERGSGVNNNHVHMLEQAVVRIQREWQNVTVVPKSIVQMLYTVFPRLEKNIQRYPHRESELNNFYFQFAQWIDNLFAEEPLSEEAAIAIVQQQISGFRPLALELREGHGLNEVSLDVFFSALDVLTNAWKPKEHISKLAAGSLINAQDVFISLSGVYSSIGEEKLQEIKQQVSTRIAQCLE